jgi:hypothetical protein
MKGAGARVAVANHAHVLPKDSVKDKLAIRAAQVHTAHQKRGEGGFAATFIYQPTDFLEMDHGSLFVTVEVQGSVKEAAELSDLITSAVRNEYYRDLNRDPLGSFESALQRLNEELAEYASSGKLGWVGKVSAVIAALAGRTLHLTQLGSSHAHLLRAGKLSNISEGLGEGGNSNPLKTFLNIASGELAPGDRLILGTDSLFFVAPQTELVSLLGELSPARALDRLRPELEADPKLERLAAILVEVTTEDKLAKAFVETEPSEVVIDRSRGLGTAAAPIIGKVAGRTADLGGTAGAMATSTLKDAKVGAGNFAERLRRRAEAKRAAAQTEPAKSVHTEDPKQVEPEKKVSKPSKPTAPAAGTERSRSALTSKLPALPRLRLKTFPRPASSRASLALIAVLALSLGVLGWRMYDAAQVKAERTAIVTATAREQELAASLSDPGRAAQLYTQALEALQPALKSRNAERRKQATSLRDRIQSHRDTLDKVTRLSSPAQLADLGTLGDEVSATALVRAPDGSFYSADRETGAVYKVTTTGPQTLPSSAALPVVGGTLGPENIPTLLLSRGVAEVTDTSVGKPPVSIGEWPGAVDVASFGNFLYLLDSGAGRVWRVPKSVGGYGKPQDYLGNENDQKIRGAASIAIDGNIYVLQGNGEIWKFNQGARAPFTLSGLPSPIPADSRLFAREGFSSLYVLDPAGGRVVVLSLEGAYQRSFVSDAWKDARGLWVDEAGKNFYVLAKNKLYRSPL